MKIFELLKSTRGEFNSIRKKIAALNDEHLRTETIAVSLEERRATLLEEIDARAQQGRRRLLNHAITNDLADNSDILVRLIGADSPKSDDIVEFLCAAFGREIKERFEQALKASWPQDFLTAEQKKRKLDQIEKERLELEREEEAICVELERCGTEVERRPDLSPEVFLEFKAS